MHRAALAAFLLVAPAAAVAGPVTVVELFTSQGCSSCPPTEANVAKLNGRQGVLTLSFGVDYWDKLGWKDTFARPDFTARQVAYAPRLGHDGPFTPQVVVNGRADTVGGRLTDIEKLVDAARLAGPAVEIADGRVTVAAGNANSEADIWLVRYDPRTVMVPIKRGENGGRTLPHTNVVRDLVRLGGWSGASVELPVAPAAQGLKTAVLVQAKAGGPVLAAAAQ